MTKTAQIYGAGIAGLVAAIHLARQRYQVTVFEKEPKIGGNPLCHPSIHMSPLHLEAIEKQIGLDLRSCFTEVRSFRGHINRKKYDFSHNNLYLVERGPRASSLETFLYNMACTEGVEITFSHQLTDHELKTIPDYSILATAGYSGLVKNLHMPFVSFKQYDLHIPSSLDNVAVAYFGNFTTDYGYISAKNGILSAQLSGPVTLSDRNLQRFQEHVKQTERISLPHEWSCIFSQFPKKARMTTQYAGHRLVLAGDIAGFLDPFFGFGLSGALISGALAAKTIYNPSTAQQEAQPYLDHLNKNLLFHTTYWHLPLKRFIMAGTFNLRDTTLSLFKRSIPGFTDENWLQII